MYKDRMDKPLVYYSVSLIIGILSYCFYIDKFEFLLIISAAYLFVMLLTLEKEYIILIITFIAIGFFCSFNYFNLPSNEKFSGKVRIDKIMGNTVIVNYGIRRIKVEGETKEKFELERNYIISGKLTKEREVNGGIVGKVKLSESIKLEKDFISKMKDYKTLYYNKLSAIIGERYSGIVNGLCFGDSSFIESNDKEQFYNNGIVHIMSVSGFHLAIVYSLMEKLGGSWFALPGAFIYTIFTGASSATIRSFIMIAVLKLSKKLLKKYDGISSLSAAAIIILVFKPYEILEVGFDMSFLATLGIILFNGKFQRILYKFPKYIRESMAITMSAQVVSMSYILMVLNNTSLGFVGANLFLVPIYTAIVEVGSILAVLYPINFLFSLGGYIIYLLFLSTEGIYHFLSMAALPKLQGGYFEGTCLLAVFLGYLFYKRGYHQFKYLPLILGGFILIRTYTFFPTIEVIQYKDNYGVLLNYKFNSTIYINNKIKSLKEEDKIREVIRVDEIKDKTEENKLYLGNILIFIDKNSGYYGDKKSLELSLIAKIEDKQYVLTRDIKVSEAPRNYDIIVLPEYYLKDWTSSPQALYTIKFINGKVFIY